MAKVIGFGGLFFKVKDPAATRAWYAEMLGIPAGEYGWMFSWREGAEAAPDGMTVWNPFDAGTDYFKPSDRPFMVNLLVDDLPALLESLKAKGVEPIGDMMEESYGRFAWIMDPDGVKLELWQPVES